jgi:hypothetical protein
MKTRVPLCALALALVGAPGCLYHHRPVADVRQLLVVPYRSTVRVTPRDSSTFMLHPPVELSGDAVFGWYRSNGQEGMVRVGVPLRDVRPPLVRSGVDWPATIVTYALIGAAVGGVVYVLAHLPSGWGGCIGQCR